MVGNPLHTLTSSNPLPRESRHSFPVAYGARDKGSLSSFSAGWTRLTCEVPFHVRIPWVAHRRLVSNTMAGEWEFSAHSCHRALAW